MALGPTQAVLVTRHQSSAADAVPGHGIRSGLLLSRDLLALCYGTRPQIIKASVLRRALASLGPVLAVDTGQHYDYELNALFYEQLGVEPPDLFLEVGSGTHAAQTAAVVERAAAVLDRARPAAVLVIGDTNSTLGAALAAAKLRIPVVHIEAGLRAGDLLMAEELNRRAVDAIASLLCTPSPAVTARMVREHPDQRVVETGDVAYDVLLGQLGRLAPPDSVVPGLGPGYVFATLHRAELVDHPERLANAVAALQALGREVVFAVHPRTRNALERCGITNRLAWPVRLVPAVGYLESLALTRGASALVTDSGGLQREGYWLGTPCVTLRAETEWEETVHCGANLLVSPDDALRALPVAVEAQLQRWNGSARWDPTAYGTGNAAARVTEAVGSLLAL
jgi:UDP-N-acetylglucosamine 2-epimerase